MCFINWNRVLLWENTAHILISSDPRFLHVRNQIRIAFSREGHRILLLTGENGAYGQKQRQESVSLKEF